MFGVTKYSRMKQFVAAESITALVSILLIIKSKQFMCAFGTFIKAAKARWVSTGMVPRHALPRERFPTFCVSSVVLDRNDIAV